MRRLQNLILSLKTHNSRRILRIGRHLRRAHQKPSFPLQSLSGTTSFAMVSGCQLMPDLPRLVIYSGIGYIGSCFSHYLISYFDVNLFKLVK